MTRVRTAGEQHLATRLAGNSYARPARKVVFAGAGIAGLTAAIGLRRVGMDAQVYERADSIDDIMIGGGIHIWTNGMRAFETFGLVDDILRIGVEIEDVHHFNHRGKHIATWPIGERGRKLGYGTYGVSRANILQVLTDAIEPEALHFGARCTGFSQDPDGVTVEFADGRSERSDVLVGSDGIGSAIRAQMLGEEPPNYSGYRVWQGNLTYSDHDLASPELFNFFWGPGKRFLFFSAREDERIFWAAIENAPPRTELPEDPKKALLESFAGWAPPTEDIIDKTDDVILTLFDVLDRDPVQRWGEGRVTLIGDAAHPITFNLGQGANLGIEDGIVLMKCLSGEPDVPTALRRYEAMRIDRTTPLVKIARLIGNTGRWSNPLSIRLRDRIQHIIFEGPQFRRQGRMIDYRV